MPTKSHHSRVTITVGEQAIEAIPADLLTDLILSLGHESWFTALAAAQSRAADSLACAIAANDYPDYPNADKFATDLGHVNRAILEIT